MKYALFILAALIFSISCAKQSATSLNPEAGDAGSDRMHLYLNPDTGALEWQYLAPEAFLKKASDFLLALVVGTAHASPGYMCGDGSAGNSCGHNKNGEEVICCSGSYCVDPKLNLCSGAGQCADDPGKKCPFGWRCCGSFTPCVPWSQECPAKPPKPPPPPTQPPQPPADRCQTEKEACYDRAEDAFNRCIAGVPGNGKTNYQCLLEKTAAKQACDHEYENCKWNLGVNGTQR